MVLQPPTLRRMWQGLIGKELADRECHIIRRGRIRTRPWIRLQAGLLGKGPQLLLKGWCQGKISAKTTGQGDSSECTSLPGIQGKDKIPWDACPGKPHKDTNWVWFGVNQATYRRISMWRIECYCGGEKQDLWGQSPWVQNLVTLLPNCVTLS